MGAILLIGLIIVVTGQQVDGIGAAVRGMVPTLAPWTSASVISIWISLLRLTRVAILGCVQWLHFECNKKLYKILIDSYEIDKTRYLANQAYGDVPFA